MKIIKFFRNTLYLIVFLCLCITGSLLWLSVSADRSPDTLQEGIAAYRPEQATQPQELSVTKEATVNQSVVDLKNQYPDVIGWLTLDDTAIDYPFVQSKDNQDYLRTDLNGKASSAGTVFADSRCDGTDSQMTILYGHNMNNGTMFADIIKFNDSEFWEEHSTGTLFLPDKTYHLEVVAFMIVHSSDSQVYAPYIKDASDFNETVKQNAVKYRNAAFGSNDKILLLSTCSYEFTGARSVLVIKMT